MFFYHHDTSPLQSGHAFYVDTRSKPPRSIWQHPYDDPTYLQSLPDTHPANPNSTEAKQARSKYDEMMDKARKEREMKQQEKRSAGGKLKDKLLGSTKAEREEKRRKKAVLRAKQEEEERVSPIVSSLILFYLSCWETQRPWEVTPRFFFTLSGLDVNRKPARNTWNDEPP